MTYGIRVENESGFTQIDDTTQGFQVLATGTVAASGVSSINSVTIPNSYPDDILVVAKPNNPNTSMHYTLYAYYTDVINNGTRVRRAHMNFANGSNILATEAADYAIIQRCSEFDDSAISGQNPPNIGLNVYQSDGTLSFTTEKPTYRVQAARHHNVTASSSGAGSWYTGVDSTDLEDIYGLAMGYSSYYYEIFGPSNDRQYTAKSRTLRWDYPNAVIKTHIQTSGGDAGYEPTTYIRVWEGHRTEIVGYVV